MESVIDKIFDENNEENIILYDENDKPVEFEQVAVIPLDGNIYVILKPVEEFFGLEQDEAIVFVIEEIDDSEALVIVDDLDVANAVFDEYYRLFDQMNTGK